MVQENRDIEVMQFPEVVRHRPGMYAGRTEDLTILVRECANNVVDEIVRGHCNELWVAQPNPDTFEVLDDGIGISLKVNPKTKNPGAYDACMTLHAGSKFKDITGLAGQNGVGLSMVNALSSAFRLVTRDTDGYYVLFAQAGHEVSVQRNVKSIDFGTADFRRMVAEGKLGTGILFTIDRSLFPDSTIGFPPELNCSWIYSEYLKRPIKFHKNGELYNPKTERFPDRFEYRDGGQCFILEARFMTGRWIEGRVWVNGIQTKGQPISLLKETFQKVLGFPHGKDCWFDMIIFTEARFSSQAKDWCSRFSLDTPMFREAFKAWFQKMDKKHNFEPIRKQYRDAQEAAKKAAKQKVVSQCLQVVDAEGFRPCIDMNHPKRELIIVEGPSAEGKILQTRKSHQALFSLRGRPLNGTFRNILDVAKNPEWGGLLKVIYGKYNLTSPKIETFEKILLVTDADPDGMNIRALVAGTFMSHCPQVHDRLFICESPLYIQDEKYHYVQDLSGVDFHKPLQRVKGLGELSSVDIRKVVIDEESRVLVQIKRDEFKNWELLFSSHARNKLMRAHGTITDHVDLEGRLAQWIS